MNNFVLTTISPIERLMDAIHIDRSKLTTEEADDLADFIYYAIQHSFCPGNFDRSAYDGECTAPRENRRKSVIFNINPECVRCWCRDMREEEFER